MKCSNTMTLKCNIFNDFQVINKVIGYFNTLPTDKKSTEKSD